MVREFNVLWLLIGTRHEIGSFLKLDERAQSLSCVSRMSSENGSAAQMRHGGDSQFAFSQTVVFENHGARLDLSVLYIPFREVTPTSA